LLGDRALVDAVIGDYRTASISDGEKALLGFVEKVNAKAHAVTEGDIGSLHSRGWSDEAIYDAIAVCALFNFYNRWVGGHGIPGQPEEHYRAGGKRMALRGYWVTR
jgi:uncharacterized peroxidase-related enzyme